jgi:signal transduction histidine kinase
MPSQAYAFFIDITEAKEAEAKILELNSELVDKNRELEQIVYITSHDLRSPLVNIEGFSKEINRELQSYAKAVQHENDPEKTRSLLEALQKEVASSFCYISASTTKMDQLLTGLLKLSRLERLVITPKQVEMSALMENVVATMQYRLEELGAAVHVAPLPNCSGEETLLNQVFSNLLDNALKYLSPDRPGVVSIEGEDNGTEVIYRVIDNGCGIAPEFQRQVFEIFRRLDVSKPGDGLGLTICTKILQRLNGKIWLSSVAGQGSTFYVSLPSL